MARTPAAWPQLQRPESGCPLEVSRASSFEGAWWGVVGIVINDTSVLRVFSLGTVSLDPYKDPLRWARSHSLLPFYKQGHWEREQLTPVPGWSHRLSGNLWGLLPVPPFPGHPQPQPCPMEMNRMREVDPKGPRWGKTAVPFPHTCTHTLPIQVST